MSGFIKRNQTRWNMGNGIEKILVFNLFCCFYFAQLTNNPVKFII